MESQHHHHHHHADASRPSLGFPLGTALLLIVVFCLSGIFSCCYHWEKIRSYRGRSSTAHDHHRSRTSDADLDLEASSASKPADPHHSDLKEEKRSESLPVLMPGDEVPRFIALPCPPTNNNRDQPTVVVTESQNAMNYVKAPSSSNSLIVYNHIARFGAYYNC